MKLSELIAKVGDKNVHVQYVNEAMTNITYSEKKRLSKITFETDQLTPGDIVLNEGMIGVIVWIPRDAWKKAIK